MQTKKVLIIVGGVIVAIIIVLVLVFSLSKKQPVTQTSSGNGSSTGTGGVTGTGGGVSNLPVNGSGTQVAFTPTIDPSNPFATTLPRVNAPKSNSSNNTPITSPKQSTQTDNSAPISYNYNQSDASFLSEYYPDAQQVISGSVGPAGNVGQDPSNQVVYTTTDNGVAATSPDLQAVPGFDESTLHLSSDNSTANILAYLNTLSSTIAVFDPTKNTALMTDPLQSLNAATAKSYTAEAAVILSAVQKLTVPSSIKEVEEGYVDNYQKYGTFMSKITTLLNSVSSGGEVNVNTSDVSSAGSDLSTSAARALSNYQNASDFYNGQ